MKRAIIRVGRLYNGGDIPAGETRFQRGCMRPIPGDGIPVVCDHDPDRQIGVVDELVEWDGEWLAARAKITESDGWPHEGTGASWAYTPLQRQRIGGGERILDALIEEVTLTVELMPMNTGARVVLLREIAAPTMRPTADNGYFPETDPVWREIWHRVEDLGEDFDTVFRELKEREEQAERQRRPSRRLGRGRIAA